MLDLYENIAFSVYVNKEDLEKNFEERFICILYSDMLGLLFHNKDRFGRNHKVLRLLDPYGDILLDDYDMNLMKKICQTILQEDVLKQLVFDFMRVEYDDSRVTPEDVSEHLTTFASKMIKACDYALENNYKIIAEGD